MTTTLASMTLGLTNSEVCVCACACVWLFSLHVVWWVGGCFSFVDLAFRVTFQAGPLLPSSSTTTKVSSHKLQWIF